MPSPRQHLQPKYSSTPVKSPPILWIECTRLGPPSSVSKTEYSALRMKSQNDEAAKGLLGNLSDSSGFAQGLPQQRFGQPPDW